MKKQEKKKSSESFQIVETVYIFTDNLLMNDENIFLGEFNVFEFFFSAVKIELKWEHFFGNFERLEQLLLTTDNNMYIDFMENIKINSPRLNVYNFFIYFFFFDG